MRRQQSLLHHDARNNDQTSDGDERAIAAPFYPFLSFHRFLPLVLPTSLSFLLPNMLWSDLYDYQESGVLAGGK
jgi:hypothetical protein